MPKNTLFEVPVRISLANVLLAMAALSVAPGSAGAQTVAAGGQHTVVVTPDSSVWTWGSNASGQLGDGTTTGRKVPTALPSFSGILAVAAGGSHTLAVAQDGTVWAWGSNSFGQLGDGTTITRTSPTQVSGLTDVVAVAAGEYHSVALTSTGEVWTWGRNANGQIGNGTTTQSNQPVLVSTTLTASAIAAGANHTLVVGTDGSVWAWGANSNGQLGDGSTTQRTAPVQMSGITGAIDVKAGALHSLVLKNDGTVRASGYNTYGQLGDGTWTQRTSPVTVSAVNGATAIAAGAHHSYVLKSDGSVRAWGANWNNQLGDGTSTSRNTPVQISALSSVAHLAAGQNHGVAVTGTAEVWTWGYNSAGQLGDGTTQNRALPVSISDADYLWKAGTPTFSVPGGTYTTEKAVVVTSATPGAEIHYTTDGADPTLADPVVTSGTSVTVDVSLTLKARAWKTGLASGNVAAATYTLSVATLTFSPVGGTYTTPRTVTIGTSSPGAAIHYTTDGSVPTQSSAVYSTALSVGTTTTLKAVGIRAGWTSSSVSSHTYTMNFGTLAAPTLSPGTGTFTTQADVAITAFESATIRYTTNGSTPTASSPVYTAPLAITATTTLKAKAFHPDYTIGPEAAATYTIVVGTPAVTPASGTYTSGELVTITSTTSGATLTYTLNGADPTPNDQVIASGATLPVGNFTLKVAAWKTGCAPSAIVTATYSVTGSTRQPKAAAGALHSFTLRGDSVLWAWGDNVFGQLGDGTTVDRALPVISGGMAGVKSVSGGDAHSLAARDDGKVFAWGNNGSGRLGDGTTTNRFVPTEVPNFTALEVAAGASHSLALRSDGTVWAWGYNGNGQIGDGTMTQRLTPTQTNGLTGITAISTRSSTSFAVKGDGTLWGWGANPNAQIGDGTTTGRTAPVQVTGITTATAVAAGHFHTLALLSDGTVRGWGYNFDGQVGDGTNVQRTTPAVVAGLTSVVHIAAGQSHSLALTVDGTVWSWGGNTYGALGDGTLVKRNTPAAVTGLPAIAEIAAGNHHSLAVGVDGSVWAWGRNADGELGDGTTTSRTTPVQIAGPGVAWKVASPVVSLSSGVYTSSQNVTISIADPDAVLHYTLTGTDPVETDPTIPSGGTVAVDESLTLKVRAWKPGAVSSEVVSRQYELKALVPTLSPLAGRYAGSQTVTMSATTPGAVVRYTVDGSEPDGTSTLYAGSIIVASTQTVKARAFKSGWTASHSGAASYWITAGTADTPAISPGTGSFASPPLVTLSTTTAGATLRYTLDGTDPDESSPLYVFPLLIETSATLKARAFRTGFSPSGVAAAAISLDSPGQAPAPVIAPGGGVYSTRQTITISGPAGATLRYTTTGVDPTDTDAVVPASGTLTVADSGVIKVRAWLTGSTPSAVRRADFVITGAIAAGDQHSLGLASDGTIWAWGRNTEGQVGDGTGVDKASPVPVLTDAIAVAAGMQHSLAVRTDGTVWAWGENGAEGRLGDGTTFRRLAPVQVTGLTGIVDVAAGADHSLALAADGTVWAWGGNADGQLGDGSTTTRLTPVQVLGLAGVTRIAAGEYFSLAVQNDGAAAGMPWSWGRNTHGQLGDGSTIGRVTPVLVNGSTGAEQAVASRDFAVSRLSDGTLRAWGRNDVWQMGSAAGGSSSTAKVVEPLAGVRSVAAGAQQGLAVGRDGRVWWWGNDGFVETRSPQYLPGSSAILQVSAGWGPTLALRADGSVLAKGFVGTGLGPGNHPDLMTIPGLSLASNAWLLGDSDGDGLRNWEEYASGTDPLRTDTNGNGLSDLVDVRRDIAAGNPDDDGDGVPNGIERANGTDPFRADTDDDGVADLTDAYPLDPTRSQLPAANPADTTPPTITLTQPVAARPVGGGGGNE